MKELSRKVFKQSECAHISWIEKKYGHLNRIQFINSLCPPDGHKAMKKELARLKKRKRAGEVQAILVDYVPPGY